MDVGGARTSGTDTTKMPVQNDQTINRNTVLKKKKAERVWGYISVVEFLAY